LRYARQQAAGVSLHVIDVDLSDPHVVVSPALAAGGVGRCETFAHFLGRLRPAAAVNGTFFSKRSLRPIGDIVVGGRLVHFGGMGTAFAFGKGGVDVVRLPKSRRVDWSEHRAVLAGGPLLVWDGFPKPMPGGEGFGDPHVFARSAPRTALGITKRNHLLLVTTVRGSSLAALARALHSLGAIYAINLDGGSSAGMYYQGRMIRTPRRSLTNVLGVYLKSQPVPRGPLRLPQGLDWRSGHRTRPVLTFSAKGLEISARLPRQWEARTSIYLKSNRPLAEGWALRVRIDQKTVATVNALPTEVALDLTNLNAQREHEIRINAVNAEGKTLGHGERLFRLDKAGVR
jgi:hypothetical protein